MIAHTQKKLLDKSLDDMLINHIVTVFLLIL